MKILDHGYMRVIETWGSDEQIIEAARMSTDKGFLGWDPGQCPCVWDSLLPGTPLLKDAANPNCPTCKGTGVHRGDARLLKFLWTNAHHTPFEMAGMVIEIQAPIFVFREWHRHRSQSYNELSARYTPMPNLNYLPTVERCLIVDAKNKQAGVVDGAEMLTHAAALDWLEDLADVYEHAERVYQKGLRIGVPKELARLPVPVARYSRMRASANLRNWLNFFTLRSASNAQQEIQAYSHAGEEIASAYFPRTMRVFRPGA